MWSTLTRFAERTRRSFKNFMSDLATIRSILPKLGSMEECVARAQYQRPAVLKRGSSWCIRPRVPKLDARTGRFRRVQTWIVLGRVDTMTKAEASKKADHFMATINDGRFVAAAQLEFVGVVAKYQEAKLPLLGSRTRDKYAAHIRNHILPAFGACRLADIDTQAVEAWLVGKRGELADATRADLLHVLSAIFSAAIKWRYWSGENPCTGVELGRIEPKREKRLLTIDEIRLSCRHWVVLIIRSHSRRITARGMYSVCKSLPQRRQTTRVQNATVSPNGISTS